MSGDIGPVGAWTQPHAGGPGWNWSVDEQRWVPPDISTAYVRRGEQGFWLVARVDATGGEHRIAMYETRDYALGVAARLNAGNE